MKRFVQWLSLLLCFALAFGTVGCRKKQTVPPAPRVEKATFNGTHIVNATDSDDAWLVRDGKTPYVLLIPFDASARLKQAKEEFTHLFSLATGITIAVQTDDEEIAADGKYISLGETALYRTVDIDCDQQKLTPLGVRMATRGDDAFLLAGSDSGLRQTVYSFMRIYFDFDVYYRNCLYIDRNVRDAKWKALDVTDIPDIPMLVADNRLYETKWNAPIGTDTLAGMTAQDTLNRAARLGYSDGRADVFIPIIDNGGYYTDHNVMHYMPANQDYSHWFADGVDRSSKWLSLAKTQACYNAQGDDIALDAMVKQFASAVENSLKAFPVKQYPDKYVVPLTATDGYPYCDCETCVRKAKEDGDAPVGSTIRFVNRVRKAVGAWMALPENEPYRRDNLVITFFAYGDALNPPVVTDENGNYKLANDSCAMDKGVGVNYAANLDFCYNKNIYESVQDGGRENLDKWAFMTDFIWMWTYGTYYHATVYFCDTLNFFDNDAFRYLASRGVKQLFNESQDYGDGSTGWANLKDYLGGKLAWNVNADIPALIDKYFDAMYGPAAAAMQEALTAQRLYYAAMLEEKGLNTSESYYNGQNMQNKTEFFGLNTLESFLELFDKALAAIEPYKTTDPDLYTVYWSRIEMETVATLTIMLRLYGQGQIDSDTLAVYKNRLYDILVWYPETKYAAGNTTDIIGMLQ